MIISNFKNLARNSLRRKALLIAEAGYEAIEIEKTVSERINLDGNILEVRPPKIVVNIREVKPPLKLNLNNFKRVFIVGVGKGSALASVALAEILKNKLTSGIALDIVKPKFKIKNWKLKIFKGTHPLPSKQNIRATREIIKLAKNLNKDDLLITFICGGGSALMCGSEKELKHSQEIFKHLTEVGADIFKLNTIRKHLSEVKGGGLAKMAYPATIVSLIVSDICGNDLSFIASGPTVYDKTTNKDAEKILKKYGLESKKFHFHENPKEKKYFKKVKNILFICNQDAIMAMMKKSKELGFKTKIYSLTLQGEAKNALMPMIKMVKSGQAFLAAGETTVDLEGRPKGKGGRNTESVLGALAKIKNLKFKIENLIIMSFTSDGHDNTEAAGAISDILTLKKAEESGISPEEFLKQNKSFDFFDKTDDLIYAKKKCFNVADLMVVLK